MTVPTLPTDTPGLRELADGAHPQLLAPERAEMPVIAERAAARAEEQAKARADVEHSAQFKALLTYGDRLRTTIDTFAAKFTALDENRDLSEAGRARQRATLEAQFNAALEEISGAFVADEGKLLERHHGHGEAWAARRKLTTDDAARLTTLATVLPHWPPQAAIRELEDAIAEGDRALLVFLTPMYDTFLERDPRYADVRETLTPLLASARVAMGDRPSDAAEVARARAAALRGALAGAIRTVRPTGGDVRRAIAGWREMNLGDNLLRPFAAAGSE